MSVVTCNLNSQLIQNCTSELKLQNSSEAMHFILDVNCSETVCSCDYSFFSQNFLSLGIFSTSSCPFFRFFDDVLLINDFLLKKIKFRFTLSCSFLTISLADLGFCSSWEQFSLRSILVVATNTLLFNC